MSPAADSRPRPHGDEATTAGLAPQVLVTIDAEMQRHVAAHKGAGPHPADPGSQKTPRP